jgi:2-haloacid dehalogenase
MLTAFPDVKPGLEVLKKKGLRLAILSNGEPSMLQATAESAGVAGLLDAIISVEDVETFKPAPQVYKLVAPRLNVAATESGFVSSNNWASTARARLDCTPFGSSAARPSRKKSSGFRPNAS